MESRFNDNEDLVEPITYICGECGNDVALQPTAAVRCRNCGSRILYKKRSYRELKESAEFLYSLPESKLVEEFARFEEFRDKLNALLSTIARYRIQLNSSEKATFGPKTLKIVEALVSDYDKLYEIYEENLSSVFTPLQGLYNELKMAEIDKNDHFEDKTERRVEEDTRTELSRIEESKKRFGGNNPVLTVNFDKIGKIETQLNDLVNRILEIYRTEACDDLNKVLCDIFEGHERDFVKIVENVSKLVNEISRKPDELSLRILRINNEKLQSDFLSHVNSVKLLKYTGFKIATNSDIQQALSSRKFTFVQFNSVNLKFDQEYFLYLHEPDMFTVYSRWKEWLGKVTRVAEELSNFLLKYKRLRRSEKDYKILITQCLDL